MNTLGPFPAEIWVDICLQIPEKERHGTYCHLRLVCKPLKRIVNDAVGRLAKQALDAKQAVALMNYIPLGFLRPLPIAKNKSEDLLYEIASYLIENKWNNMTKTFPFNRLSSSEAVELLKQMARNAPLGVIEAIQKAPHLDEKARAAIAAISYQVNPQGTRMILKKFHLSAASASKILLQNNF